MLSEKMEKALNAQVNAELYSSYLYLSMEAYLQNSGLKNFANWMRIQAQEELLHAMKIYDFIFSCGGRSRLAAIDAPTQEWDSVLAVFENALEHERYVTSRVNELVNLAIEEKDHATNVFLQWFVTEQVEEEETAGGIVSRLRLANEQPEALLFLDREFGQRTFTPPVAE